MDDKFQTAFPIDSERYHPAGGQFEIITYQRGSAFFAAWYCRHCLTRTETGEWSSAQAAKRAAMDAIGAHHVEKHGV